LTGPELELQKMAELGRLSAGIVHEINTPVGSILSNNDVTLRSLDMLKTRLTELSKTVALPVKLLQVLDTLINLATVDKIACERILAMVRSVKSFTRTDSEIRKAGLNHLIEDMLRLTAATYKRRITVETHFGDLPEIDCYPSVLSQVFLNLIANASQAIEDEGKITIRTWAEGGLACASVSDTGHGIRAEDQPKIFQSGFTTKPVGEGTGLGLAFSKDVVENSHGGALTFESAAGAGTTFFVRLPIEQPKKNSGE
jgi:two-component system, NtrC family, sensor kinase